MEIAFILYSSNESTLVTLFYPHQFQPRISFQTSNRDCASEVPTRYIHQARYPSRIQRREGIVAACFRILRLLVPERNRRVQQPSQVETVRAHRHYSVQQETIPRIFSAIEYSQFILQSQTLKTKTSWRKCNGAVQRKCEFHQKQAVERLPSKLLTLIKKCIYVYN